MGDYYNMRPSYSSKDLERQRKLDEIAQKQAHQNQLLYQRNQENQRRMEELQVKQELLDGKAKEFLKMNRSKLNQMAISGSPSLRNSQVSEDSFAHHQNKGKKEKPAVFAMFNESEKQPKEPTKELSIPQIMDEPIESGRTVKKEMSYKAPPDLDAQREQMEIIERNNRMMMEFMSELKRSKNDAVQKKAYQEEIAQLNELEQKVYDYEKHLDSVKKLNRVGDDLNKVAREKALSAIKNAHLSKQIQKDPVLAQKMRAANGMVPQGGLVQDDFARKMLMLMMAQNMKQQEQLRFAQGPPMMIPVEGNKRKEDSSLYEDLKEEKRKLEKEREKDKKKADREAKLAKLKNKAELSEKEAFEKQKLQAEQDLAEQKHQLELEKMRAKEALLLQQLEQKNADQENIKAVTKPTDQLLVLPNGVTLIRPTDPNEAPMFVMPSPSPDRNLEVLRQKANATLSSLSSSSLTHDPVNPLQQMMLGMMMMQNIKMLQDDQKSVSTSKSSIQQPPIVYLPPNMAQYNQSLLPVVKQRKSSRSVKSIKQTVPEAPKQPDPVFFPVVNKSTPGSVKSTSTLGVPVNPPVRLPELPERSHSIGNFPKPMNRIEKERAPSIRDLLIQPQSKNRITSKQFCEGTCQ